MAADARHLVEARWWCDCSNIEGCRMERYVSDVRILKRELRVNEYLLAGLLGALAGATLASAALLVLAFGWPKGRDRYWWR